MKQSYSEKASSAPEAAEPKAQLSYYLRLDRFKRFIFGESLVDFAFFLTMVSMVLFGAFFGIMHIINGLEFLTMIGVALNIAITVTLILHYYYFTKGESRKCEILILIESVWIGLGVPCYFYATALIIYKLPFWDQKLLEIDEWMLGWAFPRGQISLFFDRSEFFGPHSFFSMLSTEVLQAVYFTYYFWPYLAWLPLVVKCICGYLPGKHFNKTEAERWKNWQQLKAFGITWASSYLLTFTINSIFPASSPRLHLETEYKHELKGLFIADAIRGVAKENRSANSFPSGHIAETLGTALSTLFLLQYRAFGSAIFFFAVLMIIATVFLRYHYFVDVIGGIAVALLSFLMGKTFYDFGKWNFSKSNADKSKRKSD